MNTLKFSFTIITLEMIKFEVSFIVAAIKYQKIFLMHEVNFLEFHCNFSKVGISRQFVEVLLNL